MENVVTSMRKFSHDWNTQPKSYKVQKPIGQISFHTGYTMLLKFKTLSIVQYYSFSVIIKLIKFLDLYICLPPSATVSFSSTVLNWLIQISIVHLLSNIQLLTHYTVVLIIKWKKKFHFQNYVPTDLSPVYTFFDTSAFVSEIVVNNTILISFTWTCSLNTYCLNSICLDRFEEY